LKTTASSTKRAGSSPGVSSAPCSAPASWCCCRRSPMPWRSPNPRYR
jgi:hypothetical protein